MCHDVHLGGGDILTVETCTVWHTHTKNLLDTFGVIVSTVGQDSSLGIATRHRLDCPDIECRWGRIFRTRPDRTRNPPNLLYNGYGVSLPESKMAGEWP